MTDSKVFLDTSAWIRYFHGLDTKVSEILETKEVLTSSLSLFEVKRKLLHLHAPPATIQKVLTFMKSRSTMLVPLIPICEQAASLAETEKLHAIDAVLYATALTKDAMFVTADNDFRRCKNVRMLD